MKNNENVKLSDVRIVLSNISEMAQLTECTQTAKLIQELMLSAYESIEGRSSSSIEQLISKHSISA